jgi:hypothetical protein
MISFGERDLKFGGPVLFISSCMKEWENHEKLSGYPAFGTRFEPGASRIETLYFDVLCLSYLFLEISLCQVSSSTSITS